MHQIRFRGGGLHWGSLQRSPDPVAGYKGPTSKGREGNGREEKRGGKKGKGKGKKKKGAKERGRTPSLLFGQIEPCITGVMTVQREDYQNCSVLRSLLSRTNTPMNYLLLV